MRISDWSSDVCSSDLPLQNVDLGDVENPRLDQAHGTDHNAVEIERNCTVERRRHIRGSDPTKTQLATRTRTAHRDIQCGHARRKCFRFGDLRLLEFVTTNGCDGNRDILERFVTPTGSNYDLIALGRIRRLRNLLNDRKRTRPNTN